MWWGGVSVRELSHVAEAAASAQDGRSIASAYIREPPVAIIAR